IPAVGGTVGRMEGSEEYLRTALVGQGDLTLSPLQAARAFAGLLSPGGMPGLRMSTQYAWKMAPGCACRARAWLTFR
ncbi:MAG: hypothetical protein P8X64_12785, partial [Anaerolineales bacterium]